MIALQIAFVLLYSFLINVQTVQFNAATVVVTIGLAILVIAGKPIPIQVSASSSDTPKDWFGAG
jgi:phage-related minor tail protein